MGFECVSREWPHITSYPTPEHDSGRRWRRISWVWRKCLKSDKTDNGADKQPRDMGHQTLTTCQGEVNPEAEEQASLSPTLSRAGDGAYSGESRS